MWRALQLTLDLFAASPAPPAPQRDAPPLSPPPSLRDAPRSTPADAPPRSLPDAIAPARFAHPRANREARLGEALVGYELRRTRRRTIGFVVGADGLVVSAPRWVPLYEIESALREKSGWIVRKLAEVHERERRLEASRIEWRDGCTLPYLGRPLRVALDPAAPMSGAAGDHSDATLRLGLATHSEPAQIRDAVQAWLMRQARGVFTERLNHFAPQLGVQWRRLGLSNAYTRWGSAGADGSIRLNWRLIHFAPPVIDYVVVHELSHLRVLDHSPRFWDTVAQVMPDYAELREQLRDERIPRWD